MKKMSVRKELLGALKHSILHITVRLFQLGLITLFLAQILPLVICSLFGKRGEEA